MVPRLSISRNTQDIVVKLLLKAGKYVFGNTDSSALRHSERANESESVAVRDHAFRSNWTRVLLLDHGTTIPMQLYRVIQNVALHFGGQFTGPRSELMKNFPNFGSCTPTFLVQWKS